MESFKNPVKRFLSRFPGNGPAQVEFFHLIGLTQSFLDLLKIHIDPNEIDSYELINSFNLIHSYELVHFCSIWKKYSIRYDKSSEVDQLHSFSLSEVDQFVCESVL